MNNVPRHGGDAPELVQPGLESYHDPLGAKKDQEYYTEEVLSPSASTSRPRRPRQVPCGIGPFATGLLTGLAIAAIVSIVLGILLGKQVHRSNGISNDATTTCPAAATATVTMTASGTSSTPSGAPNLLENYSAAAVSTVKSVFNECPALAGKSPKTRLGDIFTPDCNRDYGNGGAADGGGIIADIIGVISYSFTDCLEACSQFNHQSERWNADEKCKAISFDLDMASAVDVDKGNCWLKNGTLASGAATGVNQNVMSAILLG